MIISIHIYFAHLILKLSGFQNWVRDILMEEILFDWGSKLQTSSGHLPDVQHVLGS